MLRGPFFCSLLREDTSMHRRGFTVIEMMVALAVAGILIVCIAQIADAQEVESAQTGTFTTAPGVIVSPNPIHPFRTNGSVGTVVTFPRIQGGNVDWAALRSGRLAGIAAEAADNVHFTFDSADLGDGSEEALVSFAALLIANPDINVAVEGHTDSIGEPAYNLALSLRRAETVRSALQASGLPSDRVEVFAHGAGALLVKRALVDERKQNRRVEFHLIDSFTGNRLN
jgi:prepilin-type N-terminal cleavage/methylation domain-containing protein